MSSPAPAETYDVAVVGYGPVGAVAANLLGRAGLRTVVIEPTTSVYHLPRAAHFDDEVMRVFQSVGLDQSVLGTCGAVKGMHFINAGGEVLLRFDVADRPRRHGWEVGYMFDQPSLERALRAGVERYDCVDVRLGYEVVDIAQHVDHVDLTVAAAAGRSSKGDGIDTVQARYVIGADGARSTIRRLAGIDSEDLEFDQPWLVVDTSLRRPVALPDVVQQICDPDRPTTFVPMFGTHRRWEFMLLPGEAAAEMQERDQVLALLAPWVDIDDVVIVRAVVYTFHAVLARRWREQRVILAGDAAHQMPPFLGQGMCSGIRDAANLAWKLDLVLRGRVGAGLLDTYEAERSPHVRAIIELAVALGGLLQTTDPAVARSRDASMLEPGAAPAGEVQVPSLSGGLVVPGGRGGQPFPQAVPEPGTPRLDEQLGNGFALVAADEALTQLSPEQAAWFDSVGGRSVVVDGDDLSGWLDGGAALVRPDRYVFASGPQGEHLIQELRSRLAVAEAGSPVTA